MVSADAVLIAGVSFVLSWVLDRGAVGGTALLVMVGTGAVLTLVLATLSIQGASRALLSDKPWRRLFKATPPDSLFYQHTDTIRAVPGHTEFSAAFRGQSPATEAEAAIVNLWLVLRTHAHRYQYLRAATRYLQLAALAFAGTAATGCILILLDSPT
jgi:hypothetical protein